MAKAITRHDNYLTISDTQIPFEASHALAFVKDVAKEYKIPLKSNRILHVGDEVDQYFGSQYKKNPDVSMSSVDELRESRDKIRQWGMAFPYMRLAISNHGIRWYQKASEAKIPKELIIGYSQLIGASPGWKWQDEWVIKTKHPFRLVHGMGYSGRSATYNIVQDSGISTVFGHLHSHAGIQYMSRQGHRLWGFNTGCLIDLESWAFEYGKHMRSKPILGCGVILDSGAKPIFIPYDY